LPSAPDAILTLMLCIMSVTLHEAAHAWVALLGGDRTAHEGGQVSLNPIPHIRREPVGMLVFPIVTVFITGWPMGFASAPFDPHWAIKHPKRAARMAAAGPLANLLLMVIAGLLIRWGVARGVYFPLDEIEFGKIVGCQSHFLAGVGFVLGMCFCMNMVMFLFNLLPLPPLDGSGIMIMFMNEETAEKYLAIVHQPAIGLIGILIAWKLFSLVLAPIFPFAVGLLYPGVSYG
jgi:Zn-dependent protease